MYNIVPMVDNIILYNWNLVRELKYSTPPKKVSMYSDE